MARPKGKGESLSGWFREYFVAHPESLRKGRNDFVVDAWQSAHPGQSFSGRHRQAMANVKSYIKKHKRKTKSKLAAAAPGGGIRRGRPAAGTATLESLELAIDRCLSTARSLEDKDPDIHQVARHLRFARNEVIWIQGKP